MELASDFKEFCGLLNAHGVEFVVVGGYAFAFHGSPRFTGGFDIFVNPTAQNAARLLSAIDSREHRTQAMHREAARARMLALIEQAQVRPKKRTATRPRKAANEERLAVKKLRGSVKQSCAEGRLVGVGSLGSHNGGSVNQVARPSSFLSSRERIKT